MKTKPTPGDMPNRPARGLVALIYIYYLVLYGWLVLYLLTGERFIPVALINLLAIYLFLPLLLVLLAAPLVRRRSVWLGVGLALITFAVLWGRDFIPPALKVAPMPQNAPRLRVLTFNALGWHPHTAPQIALLRTVDADLVLLQELNPQLASAIESELSDLYPYRVLHPLEGVTGMGVLSKYPLHPSSQALPEYKWIGTPQVLEMAWQQEMVTVINYHMRPSTLGTLGRLGPDNRIRRAQAAAIATLAHDSGPTIAGGDANATPLSAAYGELTDLLGDSWREAGFGLGHTFPGSDVPGSSRPSLAGVAVPQWLLRIDYVFHSDHWQAATARTAPFDGVSDHRGVVAELVWLP